MSDLAIFFCAIASWFIGWVSAWKVLRKERYVKHVVVPHHVTRQGLFECFAVHRKLADDNLIKREAKLHAAEIGVRLWERGYLDLVELEPTCYEKREFRLSFDFWSLK